MTFQRNFFENFNENVDGIVYFAYRLSLEPLGMGTIRLKFPRTTYFLLHIGIYLLELQRNLFSVVHIRQQGHSVHMFGGNVEIRKDFYNMVVMT
jgi:hypothetical protein